MSNPWYDVVEEILSHLRQCVSVNLVGLNGSGRTCVTELVVERLEAQGCKVVRITGVAALRAHPLTTLALAGFDVAPALTPVTIADTVRALAAALSTKPSVLVIDNAEDLDDTTVGVIMAARAQRHFPTLAVTRVGSRRHVRNRKLVAEFQPGVRVRLNPLKIDDVRHMVDGLLPGPAEYPTVARISTLSGGLPGLIGPIVDSAQRRGVLKREGNAWRVVGNLWNEDLIQAIEPLLTDLEPAEWAALVDLSMAGPVPADGAERIVPDEMRLHLGELGLIQVAHLADQSLVGVYPPILAEYARNSGARASLHGHHVDHSHAVNASFVPGGAGHASALAPLPAIYSARISHYSRTEVEARTAAWRATPTAETAVRLLAALDAAAADVSEIASVISQTSLDGAPPLWRTNFALWEAAYEGFTRNDLNAAHAVLGRYRADLPEQSGALRAIEAMLGLVAGPVPSDDLLAPPAPGEDWLSAEAIDTTRVLVLLARGLTTDAMALLERITPLHPYFQECHRVGTALARVLHGDFDEGIDLALGYMAEAEAARDQGGFHAHAYVAALGLTFTGRLQELDALFDKVLSLPGTTFLHHQYQGGVLHLAALNAEWRGDREQSQALSTQATARAPRPGPFPGMVHMMAVLYADSGSDGREPDHLLWRFADNRLSQGYVASGALMANAALSLAMNPDPTRADLAAAQTYATQGPFLHLIGDSITAIGHQDPEELARCIDAFWAAGARLYAVRAGVTRALMVRARGDNEAAAQQAQESWEHLSVLGRPRPGLFTPLAAAIGLTAREREIARLAVDDMSIPTIASALVLSTRTVENHLLAAYRKVGVTDRKGLVTALATWAAGA